MQDLNLKYLNKKKHNKYLTMASGQYILHIYIVYIYIYIHTHTHTHRVYIYIYVCVCWLLDQCINALIT
jgi:hypothetical protein